ncbi:Dephospho-CoA kinase [Austwickia sp. TVS 96-490-7B]|uniref:dephospho-CoA kinase n=1 Tax=Austwickia sp. TVS 96-490-7B TaxID=2830843 RepID=UPI001C5A5686|nr:dephospho-CoA kinase [Austwickia sp. TVS 96-490-7B]MBW3086223.1 Dephospho-CoA kinase [Austwickia sp. TVS 96-490-7B]
MLRVGLTGGIGSGKSTVARRLAELGAVVIDADALAREVVAPGTDGLNQVRARFGDAVIGGDGRLDRRALAAVVFEDERAKADLEAITHPLISSRCADLLDEAGPDRVVVYDVPLLVENHLGPDYHLVVVVDAPLSARVRRLKEQRGMTESDVKTRMAHQATDAQRRIAADVVIGNDGTVHDLHAAVDELWQQRLQPFDDNLRGRRLCRSYDLPVVSTYDDDWPAQAERLIARFSHALGARAPEIEHVGSTAVPGMPGKDVIDIQIGVSELRDADDQEFVATLTNLGFPRVEDIRMDHPTGELLDPSLWVKRFHGSCDPGRMVHVHVRVVDSPGWQSALLFRDWLRADPDAADEYVEVKAELARTTANSGEYAEAKEPWFEKVWPRITAWAQKSSWRA